MEYKMTESGSIALSPTGPVVSKQKGDEIKIADDAHARWLLERNAIYAGGEVRETKDVTQVETKEFKLHKRKKASLILYAQEHGVELISGMNREQILEEILLHDLSVQEQAHSEEE